MPILQLLTCCCGWCKAGSRDEPGTAALLLAVVECGGGQQVDGQAYRRSVGLQLLPSSPMGLIWRVHGLSCTLTGGCWVTGIVRCHTLMTQRWARWALRKPVAAFAFGITCKVDTLLVARSHLASGVCVMLGSWTEVGSGAPSCHYEQANGVCTGNTWHMHVVLHQSQCASSAAWQAYSVCAVHQHRVAHI